MNIQFIDNTSIEVIDYNLLKIWIVESVAFEKRIIGNLSFVFMTDDELLDYNIKYLNHDYYTDVITFDDSRNNVIGGDILISVDRIKDNSNTLNTEYWKEFLRVIIHGVLHLCGYGDKSDCEIEIMRGKEDYYLGRINFNPFVSRETLK